MPPKKILLVRHGQDEDNAAGRVNGRRNTPLTELGRQQAKTAAEQLKDSNAKAIYYSPLQRAAGTARIIADELGISAVIPHDDLIERDCGVFTGMKIEEQLLYAKEHNSPTLETTDGKIIILEAPGHEDFSALYERAKSVYGDIVKRHSADETIILVTHGMIGRMIIGVHNKLGWEETVKTVRLENAGIYELKLDEKLGRASSGGEPNLDFREKLKREPSEELKDPRER